MSKIYEILEIQSRNFHATILIGVIFIAGPRAVRCYCTAGKKCGTGVMDIVGKKEKTARPLAKTT